MLNEKMSLLCHEHNYIRLESGDFVKYDKLLLATGCSVIKPQIKGIDAPNVISLKANQDNPLLKMKAF